MIENRPLIYFGRQLAREGRYAMVHLFPATPPELRGGNPFGFEARQMRNTKKELKHRTPEDQLAQNRCIGEVEAKLEQFQVIPCEIKVTIGTRSGRSVYEGEVRAYESVSFARAEEILNELHQLAIAFARRFPQSTFTVEASQTVTITNIYPRNNPKLS